MGDVIHFIHTGIPFCEKGKEHDMRPVNGHYACSRCHIILTEITGVVLGYHEVEINKQIPARVIGRIHLHHASSSE